VLFDCDGIIADSEEMWNEIDARMLAHYGAAGYQGEYKEHVLGKSFALAVDFYRERFGITSPLDEMIEVRTRIAAEFYAEHIPTYAGVAEVLAELRALGLKIALATSSVSDCILPFLKRHGITEAFDVIITGEMVKNGKPHPDIYILAASKVETDPRDCLVVEDALSGLQAGRGAGAHTVAIPDARWMDPAQFEGKADFQVKLLTDVLPLVRSLLGR
jgi:HAD superfamily hydrolase (TIGR01509 family)